MRKSTIIFTLLLLAGSLVAATDNKFTVSLAFGGMRPTDADYRKIYGQIVVTPRLELAHAAVLGLFQRP